MRWRKVRFREVVGKGGGALFSGEPGESLLAWWNAAYRESLGGEWGTNARRPATTTSRCSAGVS